MWHKLGASKICKILDDYWSYSNEIAWSTIYPINQLNYIVTFSCMRWKWQACLRRFFSKPSTFWLHYSNKREKRWQEIWKPFIYKTLIVYMDFQISGGNSTWCLESTVISTLQIKAFIHTVAWSYITITCWHFEHCLIKKFKYPLHILIHWDVRVLHRNDCYRLLNHLLFTKRNKIKETRTTELPFHPSHSAPLQRFQSTGR